MGKHQPTTIWPSHRMGVYPNQYVRTESADSVSVGFVEQRGAAMCTLTLSRHDARMLARRLNQCLDETRAS